MSPNGHRTVTTPNGLRGYSRIVEINMTKAEISHFKRILEARVLELDRSTCRRDAIKIEKIAEVLENNLRASERELAVRTLESEAFKLRESRSALARIEEGTFGICQECEEE